ncbi:MAG TPA: phytase [Gemmatimonadaceae bacterium]|nr:phytase [Gemmatimonadaceae bacterium]
MRQVCFGAICFILAACAREPLTPQSTDAGATPAASVAARQASTATFSGNATDSAVWVDSAAPVKSILFLAGGEGGLELHDLRGARLARFESMEAGFIEVRQQLKFSQPEDLVILSDQRVGALNVYRFDGATRRLTEYTDAPISIGDEITGLCTYVSGLTGKLYVFVATDLGLLEQWELYESGRKVRGQLIRRIPAGKGVTHCAADDATGAIYFSEEQVGVWRVAAEPESDSTRAAIDLIAPHGGLQEEVKGLAVHRNAAGAAYLVAVNVGEGTFNVYALEGERVGAFKVGGNGFEIGDAEGLTFSASLGGEFDQGALIIADEDAGNYKLVAWSDIAKALGLDVSATAAAPVARVPANIVEPSVETEPADSFGDAADDAAIWVDRKDPLRSVVIGTDKKLGLNVYDLKGRRLQSIPDGRMNNVDLRDGFMLAGKSVTVVAATNRTAKAISLYQLDPATRRLSPVADGALDTGLEDPYGLCMFHNRRSGNYYVFANDSDDGRLRQWKLVDKGGRITLEHVRDIAVGSQAEGCAADDELGDLYVAEEDVGLWKYSAGPERGETRTEVDSTARGHLSADVEGVAIYYGANGTGYVIASNQGEDNYALYRREGNNEFIGKFSIVANETLGIDGASETDGLDVTSLLLSPEFPGGLLVVQDGRNLMPAARQNFKYVSWQAVMRALASGKSR